MRFKLLCLLMLLSIGIGLRAQAPEIVDGTLTVYDGTDTHSQLPFYGLYMDYYTRNQYIIPAADLVNLDGQTVYGLRYYTTKTSNINYTSTVDVYLQEVSYTEFNSDALAFEEKTATNVVYSGTIACIVNSETEEAELMIVFDNPFTYGGGNLLIGFDNMPIDASYTSCAFHGTATEYAAGVHGHNASSMEAISTITTQKFIPKTTFLLTDMTAVINQQKAQVVIDMIDAIATPITLESEDAIVAAREAYDALNDAQKELVTNLSTLEGYEAQLADLKVEAAHLIVSDLAADNITANSATISWTGTGDSYDLMYFVTSDAGITMGFEADEDINWTMIDADGDGYNWTRYTDPNYAHNSNASIISNSWGSSVGALTPDNWLVSPQVQLGGSISFWVLGTSSYPDHFGVAVSTTGNTDPDDFTMLSEEYETSNTWTQYTYDLSAFSGQGYIAIRHYNCTDQNFIAIDDIAINFPVAANEVNGLTTTSYGLTGLTSLTNYTVKVRSHYGEEVGEWAAIAFTTLASADDEAAAQAVIDLINAIDDPVTLDSENGIVAAREAYEALTDIQKTLVTNYDVLVAAEETLAEIKANLLVVSNLTATDTTSTSATISWTGYGESYDLRYRVFTGYRFETGIAPWTTIDADGDGYTWEWIGPESSFTKHNDSEGCVSSASYVNGVGALTPDNWLVSPQVELGGTMTFWATAQDPGYPAEHFQVYVSTAGNTDPTDFTAVTAEYEMDRGRDYQLYEVDLSAFSGKGYVAIRHFNCTDQFWLNVEDIEFHAIGETWTEVNDLTTTDYALSDLTAGTVYVVEVRSHYGGEVGEWAFYTFNTLAGAEDEAAAQAVIDLINAIDDPVTLESEEAIVAAREAYEALTDVQKELVTNYDVLVAAEEALAKLKEAAFWEGWIFYDDGEWGTSYGSQSGSIQWGILIPSSMPMTTKLTKIALFESSYATQPITLTVFNGGDLPEDANIVYSETFDPEATTGFHIVTLAEPVTINPTENVWIILASENSYPMSVSTTVYEPNTSWILGSDGWQEISEAISGLEGAWMIRALFEEDGPVGPAGTVAYELVDLSTGTLTDGQYVIVFDDNKAHAAVSGKDLIASSDELTFEGDYAFVPEEANCFVTIEAFGADEFSIRLAGDTTYLNLQAKNSVAASKTAAGFTITDGGDQTVQIAKVLSTDGKTYILKHNSNSGDYFRMYTGDNSYTLPKLYRKRSNAPMDIEDISVESSSIQKLLHNGQIFILRDGKIYTVQGQLVR